MKKNTAATITLGIIDVLVNNQNFTRIVEATVRQYPNQWLWVHQRWKTTMTRGFSPQA